MISSSKMTFIFALLFSLFIVACMKEQGNTDKQTVQNINRTTVDTAAGDEDTEIPACFPGTGDGKDCESDYTYVTDYIDIPANGKIPACRNVKVTYAVLNCIDVSGNPIVSIGALTLYHDKSNCPDLEAYINSLVPSAQSAEYDKVEYIASVIIEKREVLKLPRLKAQVESNYYVSNCYQRCKQQVKYGNKLFTTYKKLVCGEGCCIRTRKIFINEGGVVESFGKPTFQSTGSCYKPANWPNPSCDGILLEGDCKHSCTELVKDIVIAKE